MRGIWKEYNQCKYVLRMHKRMGHLTLTTKVNRKRRRDGCPLRRPVRLPTVTPLMKTRTTVHYLETKVADVLRKATRQCVPCAVARRPPFWTQELTQGEEEIRRCPSPDRVAQLAKEYRVRMKTIMMDRWQQTCSRLAVTEKASWNLVSAMYTPRRR